MSRKLLTALSLIALTTGCYHVTVVTGAPESGTTIDKPWQLALVSGLVPPPEIEADETCTGGVARVETKRSFLNMLVGSLSWSLITPMSTKVTCARGAPAPEVPGSATEPEGAEAPGAVPSAGQPTGAAEQPTDPAGREGPATE